jgi:hypothetical protein
VDFWAWVVFNFLGFFCFDLGVFLVFFCVGVRTFFRYGSFVFRYESFVLCALLFGDFLEALFCRTWVGFLGCLGVLGVFCFLMLVLS